MKPEHTLEAEGIVCGCECIGNCHMEIERGCWGEHIEKRFMGHNGHSLQFCGLETKLVLQTYATLLYLAVLICYY